MTQYWILWTNIIRIVWLTVRRMTNLNWELKDQGIWVQFIGHKPNMLYDHWCLLWGKLQQIYMTTSVCNFVMSVSEITKNKVAEWLTVDSEQWFLWKFHAKVTHTILTYCFKFGSKWKLLHVKHVQGLVHVLNRQNGQYQRGRDTE